MKKFFWLLTICGSLFGGLIVVVGVSGASGAPQEAAAAALGLSCAVIPYCLSRAISEIGK